MALQGVEQALVGEDRRVDRVRELAQAGQQRAEVALEFLERLAGAGVAPAQVVGAGLLVVRVAFPTYLWVIPYLPFWVWVLVVSTRMLRTQR